MTSAKRFKLNAAQLTSLEEVGYTTVDDVVTPQEAKCFIALYDVDDVFHKTVDLSAHGFGKGIFRLFEIGHVPSLVRGLQDNLYTETLGVARRYAAHKDVPDCFPDTLEEFRDLCLAEGQTQSSSLLLNYPEGGFNGLHQDINELEKHVFPFQLVVLLSDQHDPASGKFVLEGRDNDETLERHEIALRAGQGLIFTTSWRPTEGRMLDMQHGVTPIAGAPRWTLGVVAHNYVPKF
jgi:hypothetical protein